MIYHLPYILAVLMIVLNQGCSFIQDKLGQQGDQNQQSKEQQNQQESKPIPINPHHS